MNFKKYFLLFSILVIVSCEPDKFTTRSGIEMNVSDLVGMNVFDIAYEYSKANPETLIGTNNNRWIVYYPDINITLETSKSTNIVQIAKKGKRPKGSSYSK